MSDKVPKPRLGYYKALLSLENPDLDKIIDAFIYWSKFVEYLIFRKENIYTYEKEYKAVKAAKRRHANPIKIYYSLSKLGIKNSLFFIYRNLLSVNCARKSSIGCRGCMAPLRCLSRSLHVCWGNYFNRIGCESNYLCNPCSRTSSNHIKIM